MWAKHWDGWNTMEGRHLVFAYALVLVLQLGYVAWITVTWLRLDAARRKGVEQKKAAKPA
jgi:hypothetical protein